MRFSKYNNPNRRRRKVSREEKELATIKDMLTDQKLGYKVPTETYKREER